MESQGFNDLIRRAQRGDEKALERLLAIIKPYLTSVARSHTDSARASRSVSDLVQEAELVAWRKLEQFRGGEGDEETLIKFRAWTVQIVRRLSLDLQRARNTQKRKAPGYYVVPLEEVESRENTPGRPSPGMHASPEGQSATPSARIQVNERSQIVREAVERIPDGGGRQVLKLYYFEEMSLRRIAERLAMPYHEVKERYRSSLRFLEHELEKLRMDR
jgi:RNA polymerase sigma factor (sigma-70 family)